MIISSWEMMLLSLVLSSILERSPSCWIATRGLVRNTSVANAFWDEPRAFASKVVQYPAKSCCTMLSTVDLPAPAEPYSTMNF